MANTMDTSLTSRARRVAVQRPRGRPVPKERATGSRSSYLGEKCDLMTYGVYLGANGPNNGS